MTRTLRRWEVVLLALTLSPACAPQPYPAKAAQMQVTRPSQCDRLSPVRAVWVSEQYGFARIEAVVGQTLFSRVLVARVADSHNAEQPIMAMVRQDPRTNDEAVYILKTPPRPTPPEYKAVHARAREYMLQEGSDTSADFWEAPIDPEVVHAIEMSWGTMALGARWPNREEGFKKYWAGRTYTFDYRGDNEYGQGYVIPYRGTCTSDLTIIADLLIRYADEPDPTKRQPIRAELLRRATALTERLRASGEPLVGEP